MTSIMSLIVIFSGILITGCDKKPNTRASIIEYIKKANLKTYTVKKTAPLPKFNRYSPKLVLTERNPFMHALVAKAIGKKIELDTMRYPLVKFQLQALKLVGIVVYPVPTDNQGIFLAPDNKVYTATQGELIGDNGAEITQIDYNKLILKITDNNGTIINKSFILPG